MNLNLAKITILADGPGVMVHTPQLILALQHGDFDVTVAVSESASLFSSSFAPSMLTGHGAASWPLDDSALASCDMLLCAPCSIGWFRQLVEGPEAERLANARCQLLVAPAVLPEDDVEETWQEFGRLGGARWTVIPPMGNVMDLGALGTLHVASAELCLEAVRRLRTPQTLAGKHVLITAGPTAEDADPVRFVTNRSTGRMGVSLAKMAARRGADVTLVHGPMSWPVPKVPGIDAVPVRSAQQMYDAVMGRAEAQHIAILCAAVADYTPVTYSDVKIKKGHEATFGLLLKRTPDILASIGALERKPFLVGFAAESDHVEANALGKLNGKNCDMLCANDVTEPGSGFAVPTNRVTVFAKDGSVTRLPQMSKDDTARKILDLVEMHLHS